MRVGLSGLGLHMNFFGHAALAAELFTRDGAARPASELARICLGAMLPDFVTMLRLPRAVVTDAHVEEGVRFHHRTDHAFHELTAFHELSREAFAWLSERQLPRGPARAVAHVGVEILLDEVLARSAAARGAYLSALEVPLSGAITFEQPSELERLGALCGVLLERGRFYRVPEAALVAERVRRTLERRPRLATDDAGQALLGEWVSVARPQVDAAAPALLAALRARLAEHAHPE